MKLYGTNEIRNIALVGQRGAGKTTLGEAMLFTAKATTRQGRVEDANTVLDFEPEEHKRAASVQTSVAHVEWDKHKVNLLDTPGTPDFRGDAESSLAVAEAVAVVVSATDGIEPYSSRLFGTATGRARCLVINQLSRERADFDAVVEEAKEKLASTAIPVVLPIGSQDSFKGVVDLLQNVAYIYESDSQDPPEAQDIPADMADEVRSQRDALIEEIAGTDEALMERYLDSGELTEEEVRVGFSKAVVGGDLVPIFATDAAHNIGVATFLDGIVRFMPAPAQGVGFVGIEGETESPIEPKQDGDFRVVVFKTIMDQHAGKISIFRVVTGKATKDTPVENVTRESNERFGPLLALQGKKVEQIAEAPVGDIAAVAKLKNTHTGDTLATGNGKTIVKLPAPPMSQITYRILPKNKGDDDKIGAAVHKIQDEDRTIILGHDELTADLTLSGLGVAHIDVTLEKMARKYGVEVTREPPLVPYRETIMKPVTRIEGKHKKQTGGRGQFGVCFVDMRPRARGEGYEFINSIFGGSIPRQFIPAVDKGIQEAMARGVIAGYPLVDVEVELKDGKYHDVDSSEMAFKIAGSKAFQAAAKKAGVQILEPVMQVTIEVPEENMGDVMGDINSRRGQVAGMETNAGISAVKAQIPMAELLTYAPDLKSMTSGRGSFEMAFDHYAPLANHLVGKVVAASPNKPHAAEED